MMIRNCILICLLLGATLPCAKTVAQTAFSTEAMTIKAGTETSFDDLILIPDKDLELKDNLIQKSDHFIQWPVFKSINAVYQFKNPIAFSGELGVNVENGILNGNALSNLKIAFAGLSSTNYNDFSIFNNTVVNSNMVVARLTAPYPIGAVTAVSREEVLAKLIHPENFFTPNNDGINDLWVVQDIQLYPNNLVTVYDRAGRKVFQMTGYDNSWDGTFNGTLLAKDTYYYVITLNETLSPIKGFISIVR